jgi:hypothetical protein
MNASSQFVSHYPILVRPNPQGQFVAEPLGLPELQATASTATAAVEHVRIALVNSQLSLHWVPMPNAPAAVPSMHQWAGHAKDDPDFDSYIHEIQRYRQEVDERECPTSSSTPTT